MQRKRSPRLDSRGLSEIVGTLLLVVIVVGAAAAFAAFVATYEKQVNAEQAAVHNRALEDIRILSVETTLNGSGLAYSSLSFVAGSLDVNTMIVNELMINGQYVNYFSVTQLGNSSPVNVCALCDHTAIPSTTEFNLTSLEQVTVKVNLTLWNPSSNPHGGFISPYTVATSGATNFLSISVYTTLGNDFNRIYTPPTAIALTEQSETYSGGNYVPVVVLDGSNSIVPTNDSIVHWSWTITDVTNSSYVFPGGNNYSGEKVLIPGTAFEPDNYSILLVVNDSAGLSDATTIQYVMT